jgi:hypothetical protein
MYKITIDCSQAYNFSFRGRKITRKVYDIIHKQLNPEQFDFLVRINILHKSFRNKNGRYINITNFEVLVDEISEKEFVENFFIDFINKMKECGFTSEKNCCVRALKMKMKNTKDGNDIWGYTCKFNENFKGDKYKQKKRTIDWIYKTQTLYKK